MKPTVTCPSADLHIPSEDRDDVFYIVTLDLKVQDWSGSPPNGELPGGIEVECEAITDVSIDVDGEVEPLEGDRLEYMRDRMGQRIAAEGLETALEKWGR